MATTAPPRLALSVRQPWAWAIIFGGKDIENRSWQAVNRGLDCRGEVAIHASKAMTQEEYSDAQIFMATLGVRCPLPADLYRGAVIGTVEIVDVVKEHPSPWFFGPRGLVLRNPKSFVPAAASGALGFFDWQERRTAAIAEPTRWMTNWRATGQATSSPQPSLFDGTEE